MTKERIYYYKTIFSTLIDECVFSCMVEEVLLVIKASMEFDRENDPNNVVRLEFDDKGFVVPYGEKHD